MAMTTSSEDAVVRVCRGLAKELEYLEALQPGLATRVADYIATGTPADVLADLAGNPKSASAFLIDDAPYFVTTRPIYPELEGLAPAALLRFAKCLAASVQPVAAKYGWQLTRQLVPDAPWVDLLLMHSRASSFRYETNDPIHPALTASYLEQMLVEDGRPPQSLVAAAFCASVQLVGVGGLERVARMKGFGDSFQLYFDAARPAFASPDPEQRMHAFAMLEYADDDMVKHFAAEIAAGLTDGRKALREAAREQQRRVGSATLEPLQALAVTGDPATRALALEALGELATQHGVTEALPFVRGRRGVEKAKSVLAVIDALELRLGVKPATSAASRAQVPELPTFERVPLPAGLRPAFDAAIAAANRIFAGVRQATISAADADALWKYIGAEAETAPHPDTSLWDTVASCAHPLDPLNEFLMLDGILPVHAVRLYAAFERLTPRRNQSRLDLMFARVITDHCHKDRGPSLLELESLLAPHGVEAYAIANTYAQGFGSLWHAEQVWPFFARHMNLVHGWLKLETTHHYWSNRNASFIALSTFPELPAEVVPRLFEIALGSSRADREHARTLLEKLSGKEQRIVAALAGGKAEERAAAAHWLAQLRYRDAVPALEAALRKEKNDAAIGAMMSALESLGGDLGQFLDPGKLAADAAQGLAKGLPASLSWVPWEKLPTVRWQGRVVPREVLQWLIVQATKLKSPEPGALLRRYADLFEPSDRERLGAFVLDEWIREDVAATDLSLPVYRRATGHSNIESKGVLAIAAACGGRETAAAAGRYLKDYYGTRAGQCKALIGMLAWTDHPAATQLMLSVGHRFRTKGIQDEAQAQAELLAERRGWTVHELADRTIPSAGFEDDGTIDLSYGERRFIARMGEGFGLDVHDGEGRKLAALPEPRQGEEDRGGAAKKALAAAKKDLKTIVQLQADRLYEALCTQRTWRFEDWDRYLNRHPVVRRLLQGLVWGELRDGKVVSTFRPLDDGTLSQVNDEAVTVAPDATIVLAHDTNLDAATVAAWRKHMADYEVAAPFPQLGKGAYALPGDLGEKAQLNDFQGHVLQSFTLRGRATKLGYVRGSSEDGGWFYEYRKRFPSLGVEALIRFTGSEMPEKNQDVALETLTFTRPAPGGMGHSNQTLSSVPAVLLSECYNDMRLIAAEGRGFDPEWGRLQR
jgi:uncharacterized protein DUF4132